jgi:glucan-binding YG repeat protein
MARYSKGAGAKVKRAMEERKEGKLRSGGSGKKVTSRKQAIAIGLSEARESGEKVPKKSGSRGAKKAAPKKAAKKAAPKKAAKKAAPKKAARKSAPSKAAASKGGRVTARKRAAKKRRSKKSGS